jgi:hypothetical protein
MRAYTNLTKAIAHSGCRQVGIANFMLDEYPLWAGLHDFGWKGTLDDVDVNNVTKSLESAQFRPCALVYALPAHINHDQGSSYFRFGDLELSIDSIDVHGSAGSRSTPSGVEK